MKIIIRFALLISSGLSFNKTEAQPAFSRDSQIVRRIHFISSQLALSSEQEKQWIVLETVNTHDRDSIASLHWDLEKRKSWLVANAKRYDSSIKSFLSEQQWESYLQMIKQKRADALQRAAGKKAIVSPINAE
jgi:hypothetical protein